MTADRGKSPLVTWPPVSARTRNFPIKWRGRGGPAVDCFAAPLSSSSRHRQSSPEIRRRLSFRPFSKPPTSSIVPKSGGQVWLGWIVFTLGKRPEYFSYETNYLQHQHAFCKDFGCQLSFLAKEHSVPKNHPYPCLVRKERAVEYIFVQYSMLTFCDIKLHIITANRGN